MSIKKRLWKRGLLVALMASGTALAALLGVVSMPSTETIPTFAEVKDSYIKSESLLLDRRGEVIHEMRVNPRARRLEWVRLPDISPALQQAILHAEDSRFYRHGGVDWLSLGSAAADFFRSSNPRGASTITMQLASRLSLELEPRGTRRSFLQKLRQMRAARAMERDWDKAEILEAYLNVVTFRGELQGAAAAAGGLFSKKPHGLDAAESLILAALVRSPNADIGMVAARACLLAEKTGWKLEQERITALTEKTLSRPYFVQPQADLAPHVALQLLKPTGETTAPSRVVSTLDGPLQEFATEVLERHILSVRSRNVHDGAVLIAQNQTGDVLAYVGNTGEHASARYVDGVIAMRQAGSTLKPFIYGMALEDLLLTASSLLEDSPLDLPVLGGVYSPRNYDDRFHGPVTVRTALASSLNVPAVRALNLIGVDPFLKVLGRAGFRHLRSADFYGPSLALGSADITLWDLVNAYRCLANGGEWSPLRMTFGRESAEKRRVYSEEAAFIVSSILSDRESRTLTFGLDSPLSTRYWTAVKTGTSKDMRDNWCVGYSDQYTVGIWAGHFSGEPMWNVSGVTGAAPVWVEIMNHLHRDRISQPPAPPPKLLRRAVEMPEADRLFSEWFIPGTETETVQETINLASPKIVYPAHGTVFALDPDIPADRQKLFFEARDADATMRWQLDGEDVGSAVSMRLWSPAMGHHTLSLVDHTKRVLDSVPFEVRGIIGISP